MPPAELIAVPAAPVEDDLVRANLPLVHYAVGELANRIPRHVSRDDLVSAGMAGLAQAARSFDAGRGVSFSRYASTRIKGALLDELRSRDWATRSVRTKARQVTGITDALTSRLGRAPSAHEVAAELGMDTTTVAAISDDVHRAVVLNFEALGGDGSIAEVLASDSVAPDEVILDRERRAYLVAAVAALPARLRRVVVGSYLEDLPMGVLAGELGVTDSRISQMRTEALGLLKDGINSQLDPDLVDSAATVGAAKRRALYFDAIATSSSHHQRMQPDAATLAAIPA